MNRIFHVKIAGGTYLFLILLTAVMVFAFWCMKAMIGLVVALAALNISLAKNSNACFKSAKETFLSTYKAST